ncbi:MAG: hypothetical protein WBD20_11910 [Pirellulaceae bacterium]
MLSLPDESPTLGSSLVLGRSLSDPLEPELLVDRDVDWESEPLDDVGTLVESSLRESLPESEVLVDRESEPDPLPDAESLSLPDPEPLPESDPLPDAEPLWLPLAEALSLPLAEALSE